MLHTLACMGFVPEIYSYSIHQVTDVALCRHVFANCAIWRLFPLCARRPHAFPVTLQENRLHHVNSRFCQYNVLNFSNHIHFESRILKKCNEPQIEPWHWCGIQHLYDSTHFVILGEWNTINFSITVIQYSID